MRTNGAGPPRTDVFLHNLGVVSIKERRGEPSQVELDVSLCCFDVPLVGEVHGFPPVGRQRNPNQAWTHTAARRLVLISVKQTSALLLPQGTFLFASPLHVIRVPNLRMSLFRKQEVGAHQVAEDFRAVKHPAVAGMDLSDTADPSSGAVPVFSVLPGRGGLSPSQNWCQPSPTAPAIQQDCLFSQIDACLHLGEAQNPAR